MERHRFLASARVQQRQTLAPSRRTMAANCTSIVFTTSGSPMSRAQLIGVSYWSASEGLLLQPANQLADFATAKRTQEFMSARETMDDQ
jgi:hypothetical protein